MAGPQPRSQAHPALNRIAELSSGAGIVQALAEHLAPSDLSTLLLHVFEQRSASRSGADVMRHYRRDRFVAPTPVDTVTLARVELAVLEATASEFEPVTLAPVVPLGTHHALGATPQNNVVSTSRMTEVAADPTNALSLEAALRRQRLLRTQIGSTEIVNLVATQRVTRAQRFDGPRSFAHFSLLGLVSAGCDVGNFEFETQAIRGHLNVLIASLRTVTAAPISLRLSAFTGVAERAVDQLATIFSDAGLDCAIDPDREHGRGYYRNMCFKVLVEFSDGLGEVGDGGDVWWTQELLGNKKERLMISGLGLERVALLVAEQGKPL